MSSNPLGTPKPLLEETPEEVPTEQSKARLAHQAFIERKKAKIAELRAARASRPRSRRRGCGSCG